jgi:hypothetical protein
MDAQALLKERSELFANAFQFKKNARTPTISNFFSWMVLDAGKKLDDALYSYELSETICDDFHQLYPFDGYIDLLTRNPMQVTTPLGGGFHSVDSVGEKISVKDHRLMEGDEYVQFNKDPMGFYWTKLFKRYCKEGITVGGVQKAVAEYCTFGQYAGKMIGKCIGEYGALFLYKHAIWQPFELLFDTMRGIRELSLDIRKHKSEMKEMMDIIFNTFMEPVVKANLAGDHTGFIAPVCFLFLGHSILNPTQFGELYYPYFKKVLDLSIAAKKPLYAFCESTILRFAEYFEDIPKGALMIHLEQDDIFEVRKRLPNIALSGGMTTGLLGHGTKEECVTQAKKLVDGLGVGFAMSQDKMMSFRNDAKRENLIAVNEFLRNYHG